MRIHPITKYNNQSIDIKRQEKLQKNNQYNYTTTPITHNYNDYLVSFEGSARVDKGLERFYEANKDKMPERVKKYIETLEDKSSTSPLDAQRKAYELLEVADTIEDIKGVYPEFEKLKNPNMSQASIGILRTIKEDEEILALSNHGILKSKENLTVYLVKKIYLENQTLQEINEALEQDLNEDFKADYKFKNPDKDFIHRSTLDALGINRPNQDYRNSLRYTKDGYSDMMGDLQRKFWDSLDVNERTARAKKSVEKFEIWWNSLTQNQKLEMIADQVDELEMLKSFKKLQKANTQPKTSTATVSPLPAEEIKQAPARTHVKVGSSKLSQDELFIKWSTNKLQLFMENLSEADKDSLHVKRMQKLAARWAQMTPTERTDYISKMKSGTEKLRFAMINTWNNSTDIIKDLSRHLIENQIYKPADLLYSTEEFSQHQSLVMTEFWAKHPQHAENLGKRLSRSHEEINMAISRGTFEELKRQIIRNRDERIREFAKYKLKDLRMLTKDDNNLPDYMKAFKEVYLEKRKASTEHLPGNYLNDYFKVIQKNTPKEQVEEWIEILRTAEIPEEMELLEHFESSQEKQINNALRATLAKKVYECTGDARVFNQDLYSLKFFYNDILNGNDWFWAVMPDKEDPVTIYIKSHNIDKDKVARLYNSYKQPLTEYELQNHARAYFKNDSGNYAPLEKYLKDFGSSLNMIFSPKSAMPNDVKTTFLNSIIDNMPFDLRKNYECIFNAKTEQTLKTIKFFMSTNLDNILPEEFVEHYLNDICTYLRKDNPKEIDAFFKEIKLSRGNAIFTHKFNLSLPIRLETLAMETALGDVLYRSINEPSVYHFDVENQVSLVKYINKQKKFPWNFDSENLNPMQKGTYNFTAQKRVNYMEAKQKYKQYMKEIQKWFMDVAKAHKNGSMYFETKDLLHILNPTGKAEKSVQLLERIDWYELDILKHAAKLR